MDIRLGFFGRIILAGVLNAAIEAARAGVPGAPAPEFTPTGELVLRVQVGTVKARIIIDEPRLNQVV